MTEWTLMKNKRKFSKQILAGERFEVKDPINNRIREVPAKCIRQHFFAFSHLRPIVKKKENNIGEIDAKEKSI